MKKYVFPSCELMHFPTILEFLRSDFKHGFDTRELCFARLRPLFPPDHVPDAVVYSLVDGDYHVEGDNVEVEVDG